MVDHVARYAFDLAFENIISVTIVSHPSLLNIPHDLYVKLSLCHRDINLPDIHL